MSRIPLFAARTLAILEILSPSMYAEKTADCGPDSHWVKAHHRRGHIKSNGTLVKATEVSGHCHSNPPGYKKWLEKLRNGRPQYWANPTDQAGSWTEEERERILEALGEIPDLLKKDFEAIHRMKNVANPENPASVRGVTIGVYDSAFGSDQNLAHIVAHEMAHRYLDGLSEAEKSSFRDAAGWKGSSNFVAGRPAKQFIRPNGMLSYHEDFADDLASYVLNPSMLKAKAPRIFEWMEKNVGPRLKQGG